MCLPWISSLYHCYGKGLLRHFLFCPGFLNTFSLDLISSSYREGGISCGTGLKGILMVHYSSILQKVLSHFTNVSLCPVHDQDAPCKLHTSDSTELPPAMHWSTEGHTREQILQAAPSRASMCALIKKQGSHPEVYSRSWLRKLYSRSVQSLCLPGVIPCWPHSPRPPSLRMPDSNISGR